MSRVASLFGRRVPLRIWIPIVIACAAAGFVASTLWPVRPIPNTPHVPRSEGSGQAPVIASPTEAPSIVLAADAVDLPTPVRSIAERHEKVPADVRTAAPAAKGARARARAARTDNSATKARRPQRTAQQPANAPPKSSAGLKNVPIIGPMFSLFQ
jgi:hypothetical protein